MQIPQKLVYEKFYVHKIAAADLSKIYFLKNAKKTCKPNNRDLNRDWISDFLPWLLFAMKSSENIWFSDDFRVNRNQLIRLTLFRMGFFGAAHGWGRNKKAPPSLKSVTHILQWWNLAQLYLTQRRSKNISVTWHTPWILLTSVFFHWKSSNFAISRNTDIDCILIKHFY